MSPAREPRAAVYIEAGTWPDATLTADTPAHLVRVQATCRALRDHIDASGESVRAIATRAGVAHTTITRVLSGQTWCDLATLAALEDALGANVWVRREDFGQGRTQS